MATRIGVDVGGTFTDLIAYDETSGEVTVAKVPTTPSAPENAVMDVIREGSTRNGIADASCFMHGTTVGLNAILERRGVTVGLLATAGFRDVLEIRRGHRANVFDLFWKPPPPLVPRRLRRPVRERVMATGAVREHLVREDVAEALERFDEAGVSCIAVAFLNAYVNPANELAAEAVLRSLGFEGAIALSHRISGEYREYERTSTTVIDAYIRPRTAQYLSGLADDLARERFAGAKLVMRSGGGAMHFDEAAARPVETTMSGPVGGAEGAGELARSLGLPQVITGDVGGTSFDTCLISGGRPSLMYEGAIDGMPVQTPWVDIRSIGAGGGSIVHIDSGGLLRVGPRSAGAVPGPVSYRRGGTEPTVTDCAALLGMLGDGRLASGIELDVGGAGDAVAPIARTLGLSVEDTCAGAIRIAAAGMADAIREITIERGEDPRLATLMTFGGAGPLFGTLLADELGIDRVVVPAHAGNFSAWGLLSAQATRTAARTRVVPLDAAGVDEAARSLSELFGDIAGRGRVSQDEEPEREATLEVRYRGQDHTLAVTVSACEALNAQTVRRDFKDAYLRAYGHASDDPAEIVTIRATERAGAARTSPPRRRPHPGEPPRRSIDAWSFARGERRSFSVVDREQLSVEAMLDAPSVITEPTATTYLDDGWRAAISDREALVLERTDTR